jgi:hypothetical protein
LHTAQVSLATFAKHYSRTDDLSKHLQATHEYGFKKAGHKAGSLRLKSRRRARDEDSEMAAAILKQLQPQKKGRV